MKSIPWCTVVCTLVLAIGLVSPAMGQDANTPATPADSAARAAAGPEQRITESQPAADQPQVVEQQQAALLQQQQQMAGPELRQRMKTRVSVDFREAPMEDVIKSLAQQADIDIVKGPSVTGTVTATLTDVPLDEAMDSIFSVHGFGYTTSETIVRIVPKTELAQYMIKMQTKIYHIDYADCEAVSKAVTGMLSPQGKIAMNKATSHLCITDSDQKIEQIDKFIEEMDRETPQILVEARIYDVSCSIFLDLGIDWSAGTFTLVDAATGLPLSRTSPYVAAASASTITTAPKATGVLRLGVVNGDTNIDAVLTAARDDVKARLLANPKILVLNGEQAKISIVTEIPYQELTQTSGGGNIGTTKFKEVGVTLEVTPQIARDEKIRLTLKPTFSVQTGTVPLAIPTGIATAITSPQPIVDKREEQTFALIQDGQTVVIGGLKKRDVVQEISRIPLLSDIPLLGELFKFRGDKAVNSELIVFITPHIIAEPSLSPSDTRKLDDMNSDLRVPESPRPLYDCDTRSIEDE
jgi:type IV pilus assembly protein PilQ